jgi:protease I
LHWNEKRSDPKRRVAVPKVLLLTGDAAESLEVMYPYQRLMEEGYEVDIAAPSAKKLQFVIHDFVDEFDTYTRNLATPGWRTWRSPMSTRRSMSLL